MMIVDDGPLFHMTTSVKDVAVFQESRSSWRTVPYICDQAYDDENSMCPCTQSDFRNNLQPVNDDILSINLA